MLPLNLKTFSTGFVVLLLSTTVQGQFPARNLTIPSAATTTSSAPLPTSSPSGNQPTNSSNTPTTSGTTTNQTSPQSNNNSTSHQNNTTPVKLTPVPDATGTVGGVPVPAATGGKPNGRYGPDDEYIASGVTKVAVPILSTLFIMSCTAVIVSCGAII